MEMAELLTNIISNFGFPIACCVFLAWYQVKKIDVFNETMNKNNILLEKLIERLEDKEE